MKGFEFAMFSSGLSGWIILLQKFVRKRLVLEKLLTSQETNIRRGIERRNNIHKIGHLRSKASHNCEGDSS